jgi:hypothetical protein
LDRYHLLNINPLQEFEIGMEGSAKLAEWLGRSYTRIALPNLLLEDLIQKALSKINGKKERDLCRFLPFSRGYMHHFTFSKMMNEKPQQLCDLIQKYITESDEPQEIQLKPIEQSYQTNKKMKQFNISEDEMDRMLHIARQAQDLNLIEKLKAKQGFYPENDRGWY